MLVEPVMPDAAASMRQTLGVPLESWASLAPGTLVAGTRVSDQAQPLFPRKDVPVSEPPSVPSAAAPGQPVPRRPSSSPSEVAPAPLDIQVPTAPDVPAAPAIPAPVRAAGPPRITIDQFMSVDLRVAKVLTAERVPKSKKLVKLSVDVGTETRTLVAGIAEAYEPEALVGPHVVIVANLAAREVDGHRVQRHGAGGEPRGRASLNSSRSMQPAPPPGIRVR